MMETAQTPELDCYTVPLYTFCLKLGELKGRLEEFVGEDVNWYQYSAIDQGMVLWYLGSWRTEAVI